MSRPSFLAIIVFCSLLSTVQSASASSALFTDITPDHPSTAAISWLKEQGIVSGYGDGTFRPDRHVQRSEFIKVLLGAHPDPAIAASCAGESSIGLTDVPPGAWFAPFVCQAIEREIAQGFDDKTFRPSERINLAEAAVLIAKAFDVESATEGGEWYEASIRSLAGRGAIPSSLQSVHQHVTRIQVAEMIWRFAADRRDLPAASADSVLTASCEWFEEPKIAGVDMDEVRRTWLTWTNGVRFDLGLSLYGASDQLERTATLWSEHARDQGSITHKRSGQSAYYDYGRMVAWFASLDLEFKNVASQTFTENIGWGYYRCAAEECTQSFISAIRSTFDFYLSEKGKAYRPHYNSIVNGKFQRLGLGIVVDPSSKKYYLTVHYGTDITSEPKPVCP